MPLYDYDCAACGRRFEVIHGVDAPPPESCPLCGSGPIRKAFAPPTIVFKGSGWAKKERRASASKKPTDSDADGGSDGTGDKASTTADAKTESSGADDRPKSSGSPESKSTSPKSASSD